MAGKYKRIYLGVSATLVSLFIMLTVIGLQITSDGDITCDGTLKDPCISHISIYNPTAKNIYIYNRADVKFDFSPDLKDYAFFTKDGRCGASGSCACDMKDGSRYGVKGWRCTDFTNATKPSKDRKYVFRWSRYSTREHLLVGFKNRPTDIIKWGLGAPGDYLDPIWLSKNQTFLGTYDDTFFNSSGFIQLNLTNPLRRTASLIINATGILDSGNITSIQSIDTDSYNVSEVVGTPGFSILINFTNLTGNTTGLNTRTWYSSASSHTVMAQAWNYTSSAWINTGQITKQTGFTWFNFTFPIDGSEITSGGITQIRIQHLSPGNINDDIAIDYIELLDNRTTLSGTYTSEVFNAGYVSQWNNISWVQGLCYDCGLPSNGILESGDFINPFNMSGNQLLLHLDDVSGEIQDSSGNNYTGVYNGSEYQNPGKINYSIGFDGVDDIITINNTIVLHDANTLCAWIKSTSTAVGIIDNMGGTAFNTGLFLRISGAGKINYGMGDGDGTLTFNMFAGARVINDNEWHLLCGTWDGTTDANKAITYIDGTQEQTTTALEPAQGTSPSQNTSVGGTVSALASPDWLNGSIDETVIFNRELSADEILAMYQRGVLRLNLSVRSCNDSVCAGESYIDGIDTSPRDLSVANNSYFQYKFAFESESDAYTPRLYNVSIDYTILEPIISNLTYTDPLMINTQNLFAWATNRLSNTTLRIWNSSVPYDNTNTNATETLSHSIYSLVLNTSAIYNFNATSCNVHGCDSQNGTFLVVDIDITYDLNNTIYMRNESIDSKSIVIE